VKGAHFATLPDFQVPLTSKYHIIVLSPNKAFSQDEFRLVSFFLRTQRSLESHSKKTDKLMVVTHQYGFKKRQIAKWDGRMAVCALRSLSELQDRFLEEKKIYGAIPDDIRAT